MIRDKKSYSGFTIIETMLFLALSGLMLVGLLVGIGGNISRTRYRDSVDSIVSTLRDQYERVNRTQISKRSTDEVCKVVAGSGNEDNKYRGRSYCSVYGLAIILGLDNGTTFESTSVVGADYSSYGQAAFGSGTVDEMELFEKLGLTNVVDKPSGAGCKAVDIIERKKYNWGAKIMSTVPASGSDDVKNAMILILRSPYDGTIHTYVYDYSGTKKSVDVSNMTGLLTCEAFYRSDANNSLSLKEAIANSKETSPNPVLKKKSLYLCVASEDALATYGKRRMIKIAQDGHGSSAVSLIDMESDDVNEDGETMTCL